MREADEANDAQETEESEERNTAARGERPAFAKSSFGAPSRSDARKLSIRI